MTRLSPQPCPPPLPHPFPLSLRSIIPLSLPSQCPPPRCSNPTQGDLFGYILDLTGGITSSLTGFVVPALAYLQATKGMVERKDVDGKNIAAHRTGCKVLAVFGCAIMVMVPTAVVLKAMGK